MLDKNGIEIKTGDIVKIENAFFKNDNGYYFVDNAPGDVSWCGSDYSLHKIGKRGKISTAKYNIAFWPLSHCCNDRMKNAEATEHDKENATIEVIYDIDNSEVIAHFEEKAKNCDEMAITYSYRFGEESETTKTEKKIAEHYHAVVERMKKTEEPETTTQEPETIEESETLTDEEITVSEGMKFIDNDNKVFEITKLDNMSVEFNNGERALYDFGTSRTLKAVLDALGNGAKYQNAQTKKGSLAENLCKTTENGNTENADTDSIAESTEESKEEVAENETTTEQKEENHSEIRKQIKDFVYGDSDRLDVEIENGRFIELIRNGGDFSFHSAGYDDILDKENAIDYAMQEIEDCELYGWKVVSIAEIANETEAKTTDIQKEEPTTAPSFEDLARAFVTGKTVKKQKKKEEPKKEPQEQEEEPKEDPKEPPKPQKAGYGYEESSDYFTKEEITDLENGKQVTKPHEYRKNDVAIYFSTPYTLEGARLVYELSTAGHDAHYRGFIVNHKFYNDKDKISEEMKTDINTEVKRLLPTEQDAEKNAGELSDHEKESIEYYRNNDFLNDAQKHFYKGTEPELVLYHPYNSFGYDECIKYMLNPTEYTQEQAKEYIEGYYRVEVLKDYMRYNHTTAILAKIRADKDSETQKMKRIMDSIDKEKSVKVTLTNGNTVKVDADAVKRIGYSGYISSYSVSACDRQYLGKDEYNRESNIKADDIKQITHGQRILYKVA